MAQSFWAGDDVTEGVLQDISTRFIVKVIQHFIECVTDPMLADKIA